MKNIRTLCFLTAIGLLLLGLTSGFEIRPTPPLDGQLSVAALLRQLGDKAPDHLPRTDLKGVSADLGRRLIHEGISRSGRQSKHFVCTSCHNTVREDPDLRRSDPEARLRFAVANNLPFLPGTTLYGVVNRTSYYNGDYDKKYGDLVRPARHDLRGAIQLCATECAQGDALDEVEMESVLAYLWTIDLKVQDLALSSQEEEEVEQALAGTAEAGPAIALVKRHYLPASPATFVTPPPDRRAGYAETGHPEQGAIIYARSCLHCHGEQRYSFFNLDQTKYSFDYLAKHFPRYTRYSTYQVVRYGTSPIPGKQAYMPHYPLERMSNQQLEDLRAYIFQGAGQPLSGGADAGR